MSKRDDTRNQFLFANDSDLLMKEWFTLGDAYEISFGSGVDEIAALSVVLVIDACIDAQRN